MVSTDDRPRSTADWMAREAYLMAEHEAAAKRIAELEFANSHLRQDIIDNDGDYKLDKTELEMRLASAMAAGRWWTGAMMALGAVVWEVARHFFGLGSWG